MLACLLACLLTYNLPADKSCFNSEVSAESTLRNPSWFSHLDRFLTITALVLRFIRKLKSKGREPRLVPADISADDILKVEELWIRDIQIKLTSDAKFKNWEGEFGVFSDPSRILRCGGRLGNAELSESQKHPALLDTSHHVTSFIISTCYGRVHHN